MSTIDYVTRFFQGQPRSVKAKKNITAMLALKGVSVLVSFLLVPLMIGYLGPVNYGIWVTLGSIISWFNFFDIGLGNGLRNKFAEALARDDKELARIYVSTTYASLFLIVSVILLVSSILLPMVNWATVFKAPTQMNDELRTLVIVVLIFFAGKFLFSLIGTLFVADQRPAMQSGMDAAASVLSLVSILVLEEITKGSLLDLGYAVSFTGAIVPVIASMWYFGNEYRDFRPSIRFVRMKYARELMSLGIQFFVIQVAGIVVFSTANIVITQLFGPAQVTDYNIAFKYFSIITMLFSVIVTPFWSAHTEAFVNDDLSWIKSAIVKLIHIWEVLAVVVLVMIAFSGLFYRIWIGDFVRIPTALSVFTGVFVLISTWNNIFVFFINGTGKIRLQLYLSVFVSIVNIPLAIFFAKYLSLGITGVMVATCLSLSVGTVLSPIQYYKIVNKKAKGVWDL